ncbi:hypothetical protein [Streptomyces radicis]|uniref:HEAT repeat domain-containing protein n=1 Tax=Streptomyces radicis TaxID=1750517 RepID=A0A3A9WB83_9ACTN|nr:hypothetical protein [Streptomyces radicis]RKN10581.1 hypothetical protein D7319_09160 [Streptomyces radicis]RKN24841.1 hypothetical protein D7318_10340 [Streptomyces radicis]
MTDVGADRLLIDLAPLPHPRRMRELAARARAAADRSELRDLVEGLARHGEHGARLAVVAAAVGRDTGYLASRLTDPDPVVRARALAAAGPAGVGDYAIEVALEDAPSAPRHQLLGAVVAQGRTRLADQLVDAHRERWGDAEAARLLPGCGPATVARLLPELFHAMTGWRALASRHPDPVIDVAEARLAALAPPSHGAWWARHHRAVAEAAVRRPARALALLERHDHGAVDWPGWAALPRLLAVDPGRTLRLMLAHDHLADHRTRHLSRTALRRLVAHDPPELADLARRWAATRPARFAALLHAMPPGRRAAVHAAATAEDHDGGERGVPDAVLAELPRATRHSEARRLAARVRERRLGEGPLLAALAHLPVAEAEPALRAAARRPAPEERADGWTLLVRNAASSGDPDALTALLESAKELRDEQDQVRSAALNALAAVHPALFADEAAEGLDRVAADALAARDSSPAARAALSRLALAVLREHAATDRRALLSWSLRTLVRISGHTGDADLGRLDHTLRRGQEHQVFEALRPWLEAGAEKVDHGLTFALARAVGRRARGMPELQELLWQAVQFGTVPTASTAVGLWLADPVTRDERVARVLALDASAAVLPPVLRVLVTRRTDLLDTVVGDAPPRGRFLADGATWLPPTGPHTRRWPPHQRRAAARRFAREAAAEDVPLLARAAALEALPSLDERGAAAVRGWTHAEEPALAAAAVAALATGPRPGDALPELLSHATGPLAAAAVPALARAARHVPPARLAPHLRALLLPEPGAPFTVRAGKEAVRIAAAGLPAAEAAALLTEAFELPGQHRDIRAACVAHAVRLLDEGRVWRILDAAVTDGVAAARAVLRAGPGDLPERHRERYARLVVALCAADDPTVVNSALRALAPWGPWADTATDVLSAALTDLGERATWESALAALAPLARADAGARAAFAAAVTRLATVDATGADGEGEDLPGRRRVEALVTLLARAAGQQGDDARPFAAETGELLAAHPEFVGEATRLLVAAVDLAAPGDALATALARLAALHEHRPALAWRTADALAARLVGAHPDGETLAAAARLAADGGLATGLFAVRLTDAGGTRTGWADPWRELLGYLRRHPWPDVRDAALATHADLPPNFVREVPPSRTS